MYAERKYQFGQWLPFFLHTFHNTPPLGMGHHNSVCMLGLVGYSGVGGVTYSFFVRPSLRLNLLCLLVLTLTSPLGSCVLPALKKIAHESNMLSNGSVLKGKTQKKGLKKEKNTYLES